MLLVKRSLFAHGTQVILIALYRFWIIFSEKMQDLREANSTTRTSELERQLSDFQPREENFQRQLRDEQQREENLQRQFRELQEREQSAQRQLTESRQREQICSGKSESFRNGNKALKGNLRSRGKVNKNCSDNSERFKNRNKIISKAANGVSATWRKFTEAIKGDKTAVEKLPRTSFWTTVKSFNNSANNKWIAQPRSTWLGYSPGRN